MQASKQVAVWLFALFAQSAYAQEGGDGVDVAADSWDVHYALRAGVFSSDHLLSDTHQADTLSASVDARRQWIGGVRARVSLDLTRQRDVTGTSWTVHAKEVKAVWFASDVRLSAGWMPLNYGASDAVNPTDYFASHDFALLRSTFQDQRRSPLALTADLLGESGNVSLVLVPSSRPSRLPVDRQLSSVPVSGEDGRSGEVAIRSTYSSAQFDISASAYHGVSKIPVLKRSGGGTLQAFPRMQAVGGDISTSWGKLAIKTEMAYSWLGDVAGQGVGEQLLWVFGIDRGLTGTTNVGAQVIYRFVPSWRDAAAGEMPMLGRLNQLLYNQQRRHLMGTTLRVSHMDPSTGFGAEFFNVAYFAPVNTYTRASINYKSTSAWGVTVGVENYSGRPDTYFGSLKNNNLFFLEYRFYI